MLHQSKKIKIINCFVNFLLISVSLLSCNKKDNNKKSQQNYLPQKTLTFYSADLSENKLFNDDIAKEITKRTGVTLEIIPSVGSASENISLMITNNQYPDLIFAKGDLSKLVEADALIPLDQFIIDYGKYISDFYGPEIVKLRYSLDNPQIYTVGTYEVKKQTLETDGIIQLQNAVLREFQYPRIRTLNELEEVLLAYKKRNPEINGHKTIGMSLLTDSWYWYLGLSNPGNYLIGYPDDGQWIVNQETMKATYKFLHPDMIKFYKWLNKIYHEGLLDPESFTQDLSLWRNKIEHGYVLSTSYPYWEISDLQSKLEKNGLGERTFAYLSITADSEYKDPSLTDYGFSGGWGIGISKQCKDPVAAFKFLDWMCSEEAQILVNWGLENVNYYYDSDGGRKIIYDSDTSGIGDWTYPFPEGGNGYIDSTGNPLMNNKQEEIINKYTRAEKDTLKAYGVERWTELFPSAEDLPIPKHGQVWQYSLSTAMTDKVTAVDEYVKTALIKMILGPQKDFDASWNTMCKTIKSMGIQEVEEEITKLIKNKMELWAE